ncbi:unnamed protein product [Somion occarium]
MNYMDNVGPWKGVRHRVLRNTLRGLHRGDLPTLGPGQMQLYSFYTPGLATGLYDIDTVQQIDASGQKKAISVSQSFLVTAPRFSIDASLIHSTFPLSGVTAHPNILPHIVFNDPHLPWQTEIGRTSEDDSMRIPWLAVVAFEQSELKMTPEDTVFPSGFQGDPPAQSFTLSCNMTLQTLTQAGLRCAVPDLKESFDQESALPETNVDVIFPKMDLFLSLFSDSANPPSIDVDRYKYLAHARQVNTTHMADAGVLDEGTFSIIFSHRTGPLFSKGAPSTIPKPCVVHVVSLDMVNQMPTAAPDGSERAALISLYSWTYDCLPPETINFEDVMRAVGKNSDVFGTPKGIRDKAGKGLPSGVQTRIQDRIDDGYTLLRYRVQTGEETVALTRGPLTPRRVQNPEVVDNVWFDVHSNTGEDLQIIDTALGLIDISYCTAWQLGKSLAIADQAFCAALLRIRGEVRNAATEQAKQDTLSQHFEVATSERVIGSLPDTFQKLTTLTQDTPGQTRWLRPSLIQSRYQYLKSDDNGLNSRAHRSLVQQHLISQVKLLTSAADGSHFTEFKDPTNTDWSLVLNWLMDKIYLEGIPPYYLIPDPTWLPSESIRFFYVDSKWLSALVDGALSVANHLDKQDIVRQAIKGQLLKYLNKDIHPDIKHPPQVPTYGFYLRSVAVSVFPDLVIRAPWPDPNDLRAEVLRHENVRKDAMIGLLDRTPGQLDHLILSQPPHQQCFAFGQDGKLQEDSVTLEPRKVFSVQPREDMDVFPEVQYTRGPDGLCDVYDWNWRILRLDNLAKLILDTLQDARMSDPDIYDGTETNAALIGIELNDPIYRLTFTGPNAPATDVAANVMPGNPPERMSTFALPATESTRTSPDDEFSRRFITPPVAKERTRGPPRRTNQPLPTLLMVPRDSTEGPPRAVEPATPSVISTHQGADVDDVDTCSPRLDANCFTYGHVPSPTPGEDDVKMLLLDPTGRTDVIFKLHRNSVDPDTTDYISNIKLLIPVGDQADCLLSSLPGMYDARMLNNSRILPFIRSINYAGADDALMLNVVSSDLLPPVTSDSGIVIIELKPKAQSKLTPLNHNVDLSFVLNGAIIRPEAEEIRVLIIEFYRSREGNMRVAVNEIYPIGVKMT